jgi:hypothetical protein
MPQPLHTESMKRATARVGETPKSRARWLVDFHGQNLSETDGEALERLRYEAAVFLGQTTDGTRPKLPSKGQLEEWHSKLKRNFHALANGGSRLRAVRQIIMYKDNRIYVQEIERQVKKVYWAFWAKALTTMIQACDSFRFCANDKCKRPFIRRKRGRYCSVRCRSTVNKRTYRKRLRAPSRGEAIR